MPRPFNPTRPLAPVTLATALLALSICACGDDTRQDPEPVDVRPDVDAGDVGDADVDAPTDLDIFDAGGGLTFTASAVENSRNVLSALVDIRLSRAEAVLVEIVGPDDHVFRTGLEPSAIDHEVVVVGMRSERQYTLQPIAILEDGTEVEGPTLPFETRALPDNMPPFRVTIHDPERAYGGITFFGINEQGADAQPSNIYYMAVDDVGEIVWYYSGVAPIRYIERNLEQLDDGTFMVSLANTHRLITLGGDTLDDFSGLAPHGLHHDGVMLPNGNVLALANEVRELNVPSLGGDVRVLGDRIHEIDTDGEVQWVWNTFERLDTLRFPSPLSRTASRRQVFDWTHSNAVVFMEDEGAILLSMRHQNWVIKIDADSGDVIWRLGQDGDFELSDGSWFFAQHAPEPQANGDLLIYDNGNGRPGGEPQSRAVIYALDDVEMTATQVWEYPLVTEPLYTPFLGDADRLPNGNVLLTAGGVRGSGDARLLEVTDDPEPELVWELAAPAGTIYRATRLDGFWVED